MVLPLALGLALASTIGIAVPGAEAFVDLTFGKRLVARDRENPRGDKLVFRFANEPGLQNISESPLCPAVSRIRLLTDSKAFADLVLDCEKWSPSGPGFRYKDKPEPGSVQKILLRPGRLVATVKGVPYANDPVTGPAAFIETRLLVGSTEYCGRWVAPPSNEKRNEADNIVFKGPTAPCEVECGNDVVEASEECDDGNLDDGDGCDSNCRVTVCGNGIPTAGEECDDGNLDDGDGCRGDCTVEQCGDGIVDPDEDCDDNNIADGDCCDSTCTFETQGSPCSDDGNVCTDDVCDGDGACAPVPNTAPCDDSDRCTVSDVCYEGTCGGDTIPPWINEVDYDDFDAATIIWDRDEFIEIAGPAGTDLSSYQVVVVEGGGTSCNTPWQTPVVVGEATLVADLPPGSVLGDDNAGGVGFLVVCFTETSANIVNLPACDVVLPAPRIDSNLTNGHLTNQDETICPDGILLLDPQGGVVDAFSYEGVVPSVGTHGPLFHVFPPYSAPRDEGWLPGVSIEKTTSTMARAVDATEWLDPSETVDCVAQGGYPQIPECATFTWTPGAENPGQTLFCPELFCGDGVPSGDEECDEGAGNSEDPGASCRTDCTLRRCGDGVIDPTAAPAWPEECEQDADCGAGETCFACGCVAGTPLGVLDLTPIAGPADADPPDDGESTLLRVTPLFAGVTNGSNGIWDGGPIRFAAGLPDPGDGIADFILSEPLTLNSSLPAAIGTLCMRWRQDPDRVGFIDCDGGSNVDADLTIDSMGAGAAGPQSLTVSGGAGDSGAGAAVTYLTVEFAQLGPGVLCDDEGVVYSAPSDAAVTTGQATAEIQNMLQIGTSTVQQSGQPFDCGNWTSDSGASVASPNVAFDVVLPFGLGTVDVAQVLRLNDD